MKEITILLEGDGKNIAQLLKNYQIEYGVKINIHDVPRETLMEHIGTVDADIVITSVCNELEIAKRKGFLLKANIEVPSQIENSLYDPDNYWFAYAYRVRSLFYRRDQINLSQLTTYEDLSNPKWKGKLAIRKMHHKYCYAFISWMIERNGEEFVQQWLKDVRNNLAIAPFGGDTNQAQLISKGAGQVAMVNSYYMHELLNAYDTRYVAMMLGMFFPNQHNGGSFRLLNGLAILEKTTNKDEAEKFINYMLSFLPQQSHTDRSGQYSVRNDILIPKGIQAYAFEQHNVLDGMPIISNISIAKQVDNYEIAIRIINESNFDGE